MLHIVCACMQRFCMCESVRAQIAASMLHLAYVCVVTAML